MDFSYTETQNQVRELAQQIFNDQTGNEHLKQIDQQEYRFDQKLWLDLADAGLLSVAINEEYGGTALGFETLAIVVEEAGRSVAPVPVIPCLVSALEPLQKFGKEDVCGDWLSDVIIGNKLLVTAMAEARNPSMATPLTQLEKIDSGYQLSGQKICVPYAALADGIMLSAKYQDELIVVIVDPKASGITLQRQHATAGEPQFEMTLDGVILDDDAIVATGQQARQLIDHCEQCTAAAYAMMATGIADKMVRMTASYTSEREQFGRAIATFQAVGHRAAQCYIDVDSLRLVSQFAVSQLNESKEGSDASEASEAVMVAKIWTGDVLHRVSQASQHLHGGIGIDRDYPLYRYALWAKHIELTAGSSAYLLEQLGDAIAEASKAAA